MIINSFLRKHKFFFKGKIKNSKRTFHYNIIWFLILRKEDKIGIGECNPLLDNFSFKNLDRYEKELRYLSDRINIIKKKEFYYYHSYITYSSILFGLEQAFLGLENRYPILYDSKFTNGELGLSINSLIWLFSLFKVENEVKKIEKEIDRGFSFIKMKISPKLFPYQFLVLKKIKKKYPYIKIRVDANGSFKNSKEALYCINKLYDISIVHSVEQPIESGNWKDLSKICKKSKLPIALDEELVGINNLKLKKRLLDIISPKYIILKPSICGGFSGSKEWIIEAYQRKIKWCMSSSLESKIGINAIAQWTVKMEEKYNTGVHGLNIGYFHNDFYSPLHIKKGCIWYNPLKIWKFKNLI
ncbi:O-succinylbenzoate synthase [Blattabacterium sp. (Cryptocercus kyebangensis)]|uniref:enolase C-terminal domain-like protein n=1 Tax=Blattabacterium sp. (Cryptocercus kyebangensis) TaxID=298656 RepID=UPI000D7C331F|nr:enolase C-terminal domain-like protein [Blattabacterium sp. (Cryptocercus kyebangensis)]AWU43704.1 O-succinylbenzoate synthase [Blattabacterium sp. (Cryptocercus kyebangensis)]